jgi:hypothetical protein
METEDEKRARIEGEVGIDLGKPVEHLTADVHAESVNADEKNAAAITRTIARFASLLVVLSRKADQNARTLEKYTWWLLFLTAVLSVIGVVQIYILLRPPK